MSKDLFVRVPISIIGQSIAQYNYPMLLYVARDKGFSGSIRPGTGSLKIEWPGPLAKHLKKRLSSVLSTCLISSKIDVFIRGSENLPLMDSLIAILSTLLREVDPKSFSIHRLSRRLATSSARVRAVLEGMRSEGLVAYREGEGLAELRRDFPWKMGLGIKVPFRFRVLGAEGLEEAFNVVLHALGRVVITVARSIIDEDFELFRKALVTYSRLCVALSELPFSILKVHEMLSSAKGVACKVDEDFRGFVFFSEDRNALDECLRIVDSMGFQAILLEG
jgi:hypothetical protein